MRSQESRLNGAKRIELPLFLVLSAVSGGFVFVLVQRQGEYEQSPNAFAARSCSLYPNRTAFEQEKSTAERNDSAAILPTKKFCFGDVLIVLKLFFLAQANSSVVLHKCR